MRRSSPPPWSDSPRIHGWGPVPGRPKAPPHGRGIHGGAHGTHEFRHSCRGCFENEHGGKYPHTVREGKALGKPGPGILEKMALHSAKERRPARHGGRYRRQPIDHLSDRGRTVEEWRRHPVFLVGYRYSHDRDQTTSIDVQGVFRARPVRRRHRVRSAPRIRKAPWGSNAGSQAFPGGDPLCFRGPGIPCLQEAGSGGPLRRSP